MMRIGLRLRGYTVKRLKNAKGKANVFRFKHHFGVSPVTAVWVYTDLQTTTIADAKIEGGDLDLKKTCRLTLTTPNFGCETKFGRRSRISEP